jgi:hypothetical protein
MTTIEDDHKNSFKPFYGKRLSVEGNNFNDEEIDEELNPKLKEQNEDLDFSRQNEMEKHDLHTPTSKPKSKSKPRKKSAEEVAIEKGLIKIRRPDSEEVK